MYIIYNSLYIVQRLINKPAFMQLDELKNNKTFMFYIFFQMHDFRNLNLWVKAIELAEFIYIVTAHFPDNEKFGLVSQMRRCFVSISSNIAEGCGRKGDIELIHFLTVANGSTCELQSQTILSNKLKFINDGKTKMINDKIEELKNMNYKLQQST